jgi:hypothetical protein
MRLCEKELSRVHGATYAGYAPLALRVRRRGEGTTFSPDTGSNPVWAFLSLLAPRTARARGLRGSNRVGVGFCTRGRPPRFVAC